MQYVRLGLMHEEKIPLTFNQSFLFRNEVSDIGPQNKIIYFNELESNQSKSVFILFISRSLKRTGRSANLLVPDDGVHLVGHAAGVQLARQPRLARARHVRVHHGQLHTPR